MSRRTITACLILYALACTATAQQLPLFTQYREYSGIINPAYLNSDNFLNEKNLSFGTSYRAQWVGKERTPRTAAIRGEHAWMNEGIGLLTGGYLLNDQLGPTGFTGLYGKIGGIIGYDPRVSGLCVALNFGMVQHRILASRVNLIDPNDRLADVDQTRIIPDVGFGLFYYHLLDNNDNLYAGYSMPQALALDLTYKTIQGEYGLDRVRHHYFNAGYYKFINDESFIEPSIWLRSVAGAPLSLDLNIRYQVNGSFWVGTGSGTNGAFHGEAGFILGDNLGLDNTLKIGYGFDYFFKTYGPFFGTSHEINLAYLLER